MKSGLPKSTDFRMKTDSTSILHPLNIVLPKAVNILNSTNKNCMNHFLWRNPVPVVKVKRQGEPWDYIP